MNERLNSNKKEKIGKFLNYLIGAKEIFYIDELPTERITSVTPNFEHYKCRKAYFITLQNLADKILTSGVQINPELKEICERFIDYVAKHIAERNETNFITREDIQHADLVLNSIQAGLETELK